MFKPVSSEKRHVIKKREITIASDEIQSKEMDKNDLEVAESHIFLPVFSYKSQTAERRRVRQSPQSQLRAN